MGNKCFQCREEKKNKKDLFCKKCEKARKDGSLKVDTGATLVIYNKI